MNVVEVSSNQSPGPEARPMDNNEVGSKTVTRNFRIRLWVPW